MSTSPQTGCILNRTRSKMDHFTQQSLGNNISLLRQKASKHSITGVYIATTAIFIATAISGYLTSGEISLNAMFNAQKTNMALWFLDAMPFIFAVWGQYVSSMLSDEAGAMVFNQTNDLRKQSALLEKKAAHQATHDSLTGLPNRALFIDRLQQATIAARRESCLFAVLILDMDRFKEVNDTLGHYNGDRLLKQVGLRLSGALRESDTLARIGGDEFGFILPKLKEKKDLEKVIKKIRKSLAASFALENLSLEVQASIGATLFPENGTDADTLIQRADVAMYVAKQNKSGYALYVKDFDKHSPRRLTLMGELRQAINNDELILHFQPKVTSKTGRINAVEALVRWDHPRHGILPPNEFIPLAERTGLIEELTIWALKKALRQGAIWRNRKLKITIAVNISALSLLNPEFPEVLDGLLTAFNFPAELLIMEITETSIMVDPERSLAILDRIHQKGVQLSIDDFGTGYSSLAYLKKLPVSELKIDKSFVTDMLSSESDMTIVNATIQLGHNLGLQVVAEGVENQQTFNTLRSMGCDLQQGFFISRPVPAETITTWEFQASKPVTR
jgi:diguanylate cyclase (GGDEF)-like protein